MGELLPPNTTGAEVALSGAASRITSVPTPVREVWNPDTCPVNVLPWLAWAFSIDQWDPTWTDAQKRATIKASVAVHRYKGTLGAVKQAISALGIDIEVQEWFNQSPPGDPYTFQLLLGANQVGASQDQLQKLLDVVGGAKNLRSHLTAVIPRATSAAQLYVGGVPMIGSEITVQFGGIPLLSDGSALSDGTYNSNGYKLTP